jgi:UDPglucose 6-dehydrogenase
VQDVRFCADPYEVARGAHAVALVTEWREFRALDMRRIRQAMQTPAHGQPVFLDGRNLYEPETMRAHGFAYLGIGRGYAPQAFGGDVEEELYLGNGHASTAESAVGTQA